VPDQLPLETRVSEGAAPMAPERTDAERAVDHAAIAGSIDELLPALIAKLGATGLAELEVRESGLRVRLRRPAEGSVTHDRRSTDRARGDRARGAGATTAAAPHPVGLTPVGPGRDVHDGRDARTAGAGSEEKRPVEPRAVATSPAVGIYQPRAEARAGTRVRAGDRLGMVDMLGVPQEVVAPSDGLVGASLVEAGDAVEYGQELVVIEFATAGTASGGGGAGASSVTPPAPMDH
jgi:biotin carboxyl carrier protein